MMARNLQPHRIGPKWWQMTLDTRSNNIFAFSLSLLKPPLESTSERASLDAAANVEALIIFVG